MIEPLELSPSLDSDKVNWLFHDTQNGRVARAIPTERAQRLLTQKEALLAQPNIQCCLLQRGS